MPSVFTVYVVAQVHPCPFHDVQADDLFGPLPEHGCKTRRIGSGFVVGKGGEALTNQHVIDGAVLIEAGFSDGSRHAVRIVGSDGETDVALLQVEAREEKLVPLPVGEPERVRIGDTVFALGSPLGLRGTASRGIVSFPDRSIPSNPLVRFIQTDAGIHPGDSGGPLVDSQGKVIGINAAYIHSEGLGLAIPIDLALRVADQLRARGFVLRGNLGLFFQPLDPELSAALGLAARTGLLVTDVAAGSPAEAAGVRPGEGLIRVGDKDALLVDDAAVAALEPGTLVTLEILGSSGLRTVDVRVGSRAGLHRTASPSITSPLGMSVGEPPVGVSGAAILEVEPGGPAERAGLASGDIIVDAGGHSIPNLAAFRIEASRLLGAPGSLLLRVRRGDRHRFGLLRTATP